MQPIADPTPCKLVYFSFDLETTGLSTVNDDIIQIGISSLIDGVAGETFNVLVKPKKPIPSIVTRITGITNEDVETAKSLQHVLPHLKAYMNRLGGLVADRVLVGYNIFRFDVPLLFNNITRTSHNASDFLKSLRLSSAVDLLPYARKNLETTDLKRNKYGACSYKLGDVYAALFNKPLDGAHDALIDTQAVCDFLGHAQFQAIEPLNFQSVWAQNFMLLIANCESNATLRKEKKLAPTRSLQSMMRKRLSQKTGDESNGTVGSAENQPVLKKIKVASITVEENTS